MSIDGGRRVQRWVGGAAILAMVAVGATLVVKVALVQLGPAAPGEGQLAPDFSVPRLDDGALVRLADLRGQVVLLDFFSPSCVGCVGATPKLNRLFARYGGRGFTILSMSQTEDTEAELVAFVERRRITYPVAVDGAGAVSEAYGIYATPTVLILDPEGVIRAVHKGNVTEGRLAKEIERWLPVDAEAGAPPTS